MPETDDIIAMLQLDRFGRVVNETLADGFDILRVDNIIYVVSNGKIHLGDPVAGEQQTFNEADAPYLEKLKERVGVEAAPAKKRGTRPGRGSAGNVRVTMKFSMDFRHAMVNAGILNPSHAMAELGLSNHPIHTVYGYKNSSPNCTVRHATYAKFAKFIIKHCPSLKTDREYRRFA